jgi:hypothetical protein
VANATNAANTGNIASDVVLNSTSVPAGTLNRSWYRWRYGCF